MPTSREDDYASISVPETPTNTMTLLLTRHGPPRSTKVPEGCLGSLTDPCNNTFVKQLFHANIASSTRKAQSAPKCVILQNRISMTIMLQICKSRAFYGMISLPMYKQSKMTWKITRNTAHRLRHNCTAKMLWKTGPSQRIFSALITKT